MYPDQQNKKEELSRDEFFLSRIKDYVLRNISREDFSYESLSSEIGYSRSQIHRKLKKITGKPLSVLVKEIRLEEAMRLLKADAGTAAEIAYRTGFSTPAYFNKCFNDYFGITPGEVSKQGTQDIRPVNVTGKNKAVSKSARRIMKASYIIIAALTIAVLILVHPKIFNPDRLEQLRSEDEITIAVMPFKNLTGDTIWNIWQEGIQNELIGSLTNSEELKVTQTETVNSLLKGKGIVNFTSITSSEISNISQKLDANISIHGTIKKAGEHIRVNAFLVDSKTEEIFKFFEIDGQTREDMIFQVIDSLKSKIRDFLIINKLISGELDNFTKIGYSSSPEAYRYHIYGLKAFKEEDYPVARNWFQQALDVDSNFIMTEILIADSYGNQGLYEEAKKWCLKIYSKIDLMTLQMKLGTKILYARFFETPEEQILCYKQLLETDKKSLVLQYSLGRCYRELYQYDKAIPVLEKSLEQCDKLGIKALWVYSYTILGDAYHETGEYRKVKKLYKKAEKDFPDNLLILYRQARLALSTGNTRAANEYINKYISIAEEKYIGRAYIASRLGLLYWESELFDKAEEYYRNALSLEPKNILRLNDLAYFLIVSDRNVDEGLDLAYKALETDPYDFNSLHVKGWGLYKQGNYIKALNILQRSWNLRMQNAVYNHEAFLHLEAAKKAVADQNNEH